MRRQNDRDVADDYFNLILVNWNVWISIRISLKIVPIYPLENNPALVQLMAKREPDDKPSSEPIVA